jgi:hypothetical protein
LTIQSVTQGSSGGTVTIVNNSTRISYQPATGFVGTETFTYTISDGNGGTDEAEVTDTVTDPTSGNMSTFSGFVFLDANNNGQKDARDQGIGGVTIVLEGTDSAGCAVSRTTKTSRSGEYSFQNLAFGT